MRVVVMLALGAMTLAVAGCQRSDESSDAALTSGPPVEAPAAADAASDAADQTTAPTAADEAELAQQSAPQASESGDMGDARASRDSVEPDSPTMFH